MAPEYFVMTPVGGTGRTWKTLILPLVFQDGKPFALLGGDTDQENGGPQVFVPLDPSHLLELRNGRATHMYSDHVVDPRKPH